MIQETLYLHSIPSVAESVQIARKEGIEKGSKELDW